MPCPTPFVYGHSKEYVNVFVERERERERGRESARERARERD
jgi:hypothetical protein